MVDPCAVAIQTDQRDVSTPRSAEGRWPVAVRRRNLKKI